MYDTYIYTYVHTCTHTYTYLHTYTYIDVHIRTHTYMHTHTQTYTHVRTYARTYVRTHVHTHVRTHVRTHTYIHTHIHTHIHSILAQSVQSHGLPRMASKGGPPRGSRGTDCNRAHHCTCVDYGHICSTRLERLGWSYKRGQGNQGGDDDESEGEPPAPKKLRGIEAQLPQEG